MVPNLLRNLNSSLGHASSRTLIIDSGRSLGRVCLTLARFRQLNTSFVQVSSSPTSPESPTAVSQSNGVPDRMTVPHKLPSTRSPSEPSQISACALTSKPVTFRPYVNRPPPRRIPSLHHGIDSVETFLGSLKRPTVAELSSKFSSWEELCNADGKWMKEQAINVKDRRYLLWAMERFRHGLDPKVYAVKLKKKKKIRGWGPRVQNGKRLRGKPGGRITI